MRHPYFHKAVVSAYDRLVAEGMQVPYFLYFKVEPSEIDVNIHPTKTEIKFENEQAIWQLLVAAVRDAIGKFCEIPSIDFDTVDKPVIPVYDPSRDDVQAPKVTYNPTYNPFEQTPASSHRAPLSWESLYEGLTPSAPDATESLLFGEVKSGSGDATMPSGLLSDKSLAHYQYKGQYIMTAVKSGLMVIDQHRADIRILFDRYASAGSSETGTSSQRLLFPETMQMSPADTVIIEQILPDLSGLGFDLSPLGGGTFAVNGIPAGLEGVNPITLLQQIVADVSEHDAMNGAAAQAMNLSVLQSLHLSLARAAAIPYGQVLSNEEMENIVNSLFSCSNVNYTPDGKPILAILPQQDIDALFDAKR
jgi:DNA mismatch repair protein MutL